MKKAIQLLSLLSVLLALIAVGLGVLLLLSSRNVPESNAPANAAESQPVPVSGIDPVEAFLKAVKQGDLPAAAQMTANFTLSSLEEPFYSQAALSCFSWNIQSTEKTGTSSTRSTVSITWLDVSRLLEAASAKVPELLKLRAEHAANSAELYDERQNYLPEIQESVWEEALSAALAESETFQRTDVVCMETNGGLIVVDDDLYRILTCGLLGAEHE